MMILPSRHFFTVTWKNAGILIWLVLGPNIFPAIAQETQRDADPDQAFKTGLELLDRKDYGAARSAFENFLVSGPQDAMRIDAEYYRAFCAINLFNEDGEGLMENFIHSHPGHPKAVNAYMEMGNFYYRNKDYTKAAAYLNKVDSSTLSDEQLFEVRFKLGYSQFSLKDTAGALLNFNFVSQSDNAYRSPAAYYAGYLELRKGNYKKSLQYLETAGKDEAYKDFIPALVVQDYHDAGDFDKVIQTAPAYAESIKNIKEKPAILLMLADSYYAKKDYAGANRYFNDYLSSQPGAALSPEAMLKAGISAYHSGYFIDAAGFLKDVALNKGINGQLASYYLGHSYIQLGNKPYALSAFDAARNATDDKAIQAEATFYFGKLSFDLGNYSDAVGAFTGYKAGYPAGPHQSETNDLLSEAYLRSENYDQAIAYIESLQGWSDQIKEVYQKVTYRKGTQLFNAGNYPDAVSMFLESVKNPVDLETTLWTYYWMGESYSIGRKYNEAIKAYSEVFRNDPRGTSEAFLKSRYGIGYAYFNTKAYDLALGHFKAYTDVLRREEKKYFYNDAVLRLADCYYATKDYPHALDFYNEALQEGNPETDYCYFQLGLVYGIQGDLASSFRNLDLVINSYTNSVYYDDALYQKAQFTFEHGDYEPAIQRFTRLISLQPQSPYIPYALVNRAVAENNLKRYDSTITDYERVIREFPRQPVANGALLGLREALAAANRSPEFSDYLERYKEANPESNNLEGVEFESAKSMYFNEKYGTAIDLFVKFLNQYPVSPFADEAWYYLGDSYFKTSKFQEAGNAFTRVIAVTGSKWLNRAVQRLAELNYRTLAFKQAIKYYRQLLTLAVSRKEEYIARAGLMQSYYSAGQYDSTLYFAKMILDQGPLMVGALGLAQLYTGKAFLTQGNTDEAMDHFLNALNASKDVNGAEAQYLMATVQRNKGNFRQSNETLYNLNENFPEYDTWIGKSFLLIAQNFISMGELFQARATLNSVVEKSPDSAVVQEAKIKLDSISVKIKAVNDTIK